MSERLVAMGVDGARAGWVAACQYEDDRTGETRTELRRFPDIAEIAAARGSDPVVVAIDIPIGLTDDGSPRACDVEARKRLGDRRSSVTPVFSCTW
jgi:predicted RNase H-like nuclease